MRTGRVVPVVVGLVLLLGAPEAMAGPFTTDISAPGWIKFDTVNSYDVGSSTGTFGMLVGGVATTSSYAGATVTTGSNPLSDTFTDFDDGFGIAALSLGGDGAEFLAGIDLTLGLTNTSLTDSYDVTLRIAFTNAMMAIGTDAYATSEFTLDDDYGEFFFTDVTSDTVFGNEIGGVATGDYGGMVAEVDEVFKTFTLAPGDTVSITGAWTMEGGAYEADSAYEGNFSLGLYIDDVSSGNAPAVPLPSAAWLVVGLLGMLGAARRLRRRG